MKTMKISIERVFHVLQTHMIMFIADHLEMMLVNDSFANLTQTAC